eukprot:763623-Hanusia_phi.AAC.3
MATLVQRWGNSEFKLLFLATAMLMPLAGFQLDYLVRSVRTQRDFASLNSCLRVSPPDSHTGLR